MKRRAIIVLFIVGAILGAARYPSQWGSSSGLPASTSAGSLLVGSGGTFVEETITTVDAATGDLFVGGDTTVAGLVSSGDITITGNRGLSTTSSGLVSVGTVTLQGTAGTDDSANTISVGAASAKYEGDQGGADTDELTLDWGTAFNTYDTAGADGDLTISFPALTGTVALMGADNVGAFTTTGDIESGGNVSIGGGAGGFIYDTSGSNLRISVDTIGNPLSSFSVVASSSSFYGGPLSIAQSYLTVIGAKISDPGAYVTILGRDGLAFEGATDNAFEGNWDVADPAADWTLTTGTTGIFTFPVDVNVTNFVVTANSALTIPDSGGVGVATSSAAPGASYVEVTCNDADGCEWTLGETSMVEGANLTVTNVGTNTVTMKDSGNVAELGGDVALATTDTMSAIYTGAAWYRTATGDN